MTAIEHVRGAVKAHLAATAISIRQLERDAGLGNSVVAKLLNGAKDDIGLPVLERLASALGRSVAELIGEAPSGVREGDEAPSGVRGSGEAHLAPPSGIVMLSPDELIASPLNPRKATALDAGAISDLARSIAEKGVLQNLIARPAPGPSDLHGTPMFEIVAGERRWRAARHAVATGMVAPGFTVPVVVRELTDEQLVEIALTENIVRRDMSPLEEADAIAFLHERARASGAVKAFTRSLAEAMGMSDRWVQKRVRLARALVPEGREALARGGIALQMALELSELPAAAQGVALKRIAERRYGWDNAEKLTANLARILPPANEALFDLALYAGGMVTCGDHDYFADAAEARRLQDAEIARRKAEAEAKGVKVEEAIGPWNWRPARPGETGVTLIVGDGFSTEILDGMAEKGDDEEEDGEAGDAPGENEDPAEAAERIARDKARAEERAAEAERRRARAAWLAQVFDAVETDEAARLRISLWGTLTGDHDLWPPSLLTSTEADEALPALIGLPPRGEDDDGSRGVLTDDDAVRAIAILAAAPLKQLRDWFAAAMLLGRPDPARDAAGWRGGRHATDRETALAAFTGLALPAPLVPPPEQAEEDASAEADDFDAIFATADDEAVT